MPKVYLTRDLRLRDRLATWIYGQLKVEGVTQKTVARELGITQQGLGLKLRRKSFSFDDFCFFINKFQPDTETLIRLVGADEWTRG